MIKKSSFFQRTCLGKDYISLTNAKVKYICNLILFEGYLIHPHSKLYILCSFLCITKIFVKTLKKKLLYSTVHYDYGLKLQKAHKYYFIKQ